MRVKSHRNRWREVLLPMQTGSRISRRLIIENDAQPQKSKTAHIEASDNGAGKSGSMKRITAAPDRFR